MAYGGVIGVNSLKATLKYNTEGEPHSTENVTERNLDIWTHGIPDTGEPLLERMQSVLDDYPNPRRKREAFAYLISFDTDEYDVKKPEDIEAMKDHVRQTCEERFGDNVAYSVHIQGDSEGGKLHAHVTALNVNLDTGKTIHDKTNLYAWRKIMNNVTEERDRMNERLKYPEPNAKVIKPNELRRKKPNGVQNEWHNELMDKVDEAVLKTTAPTFPDFVEELSDKYIKFVTEKREVAGKILNTSKYEYAPPEGVEINGKVRKSRRTKGSNLGTDYMFDGLVERYEQRQQELLAMAINQRDQKPKPKRKSYGFDFENEDFKTSYNRPSLAKEDGKEEIKPKRILSEEYYTSADFNDSDMYEAKMDELANQAMKEIHEEKMRAEKAKNEPVTKPVIERELTQEEKEKKAGEDIYKNLHRKTMQPTKNKDSGKGRSGFDL